MSFIAQIRLDDVPGLDTNEPVLMSFHYCRQCADEGHMSFGESYHGDEIYDDPSMNEGYAINFFTEINSTKVDNQGIMSEEMTDAATVIMCPHSDFPSVDDIRAISELALLCPEWPDYLSEGLGWIDEGDEETVDSEVTYGIHLGSKLGGWPTWVQYPAWPKLPDGSHFHFVGQFSERIGRGVTWYGGGYLYLFVSRRSDGALAGTFVLQQT